MYAIHTHSQEPKKESKVNNPNKKEIAYFYSFVINSSTQYFWL